MSGGGGSTNTVTSSSQPPAAFESALTNFIPQLQRVASTPYQNYGGQTVAQFNPTQGAAFGEIANAQGAANPYLAGAANYINASTAPLASSIPQPFLSGISSGQLPNQALGATTAASGPAITNAANAGASGIYGASQQFTPQSVQQWMSPYTQNVVNATQAEFNNQNAQAQSQLAGQAIGSGAWGGDRAGVAQGIAAGQESLAQAPVIANLENQGWQSALGAAQGSAALGLQGATAAGQLGLQGATSQAQQQQTTTQQLLGLISGQQNLSLGANEANAWLNSQAGFGMANLGNEALNTSLTGANALLGIGNQAQQQAQANLNVPYQQWIAQQAYPFQTTGWYGSELGSAAGAAGGTGSTTYPAASPWSQALGAGTALAGIGNLTGAFGSNGYLSSLLGSGSSASSGIGTAEDLWNSTGMLSSGLADVTGGGLLVRRGGHIPTRALGGNVVPMRRDWHSGIGPQANDNWGPHREPMRRAAGGDVDLDPDAWVGGDPNATPLSRVQDFLDTHTGDDRTSAPEMRAPTSALIPAAYGMSQPSVPGPSAAGRRPSAAGLGPVAIISPNAPPGRGIPRALSSAALRSPSVPSAPSAPAAPPTSGLADTASAPSLPQQGAGFGPPRSGQDWGQAALYAGLGILSGRSPNALENIGSGALEGLKLYDAERARQAQTEGLIAYRETEAQNREAQRTEDLRHHTAQEEAENKRLSDWADEARARLGMEGARVGIESANSVETRRYHDEQLAQGRLSFIGTQPDTGLPLFFDSRTGQTHVGDQPVGLKPAEASRAATSAANTEELRRYHDQLAQRGASSDEIRLIQAQPALAAMPPDQALAAARKALGSAPPAAAAAPAAPGGRPPLSQIFGQ